MKKSIKYAGVAAATLLAVAPVAAPVLTNVTTVQAADVVYPTADQATGWANQFQNKVLGTKENAATMTSTNYGTDLDISASTFASDPLFASVMANTVNDTTFADNTDSKVTSVQATAINGENKDTLSANDVNKILSGKLFDGVTFTVNYSYKTDANTTKTGTINFNVTYAPTTDTTTVTKAAAKYTTPISVDYNSPVAATQLDSSVSDVTLTDQDGNNLVGNSDQVASVSAGDNYYTNLKNAITNDGKTGLATDLTSGKFATGDATYYQVVTLTATPGSALDTYLKTEPSDGTYTINGVSYANTNNGTIVAGDDTTGATISLVREINVGSKEAASWTTTDETGVVTTKTDKTYYTMKNDDNDTITNRALAANTSWKYDQVRTNANGDVQYRVSTHEWVPAESVTVNDDNNSGSETPEGALTVTNLDTKGVVSLATPGMTYFVYNKEGVMSTTRALAGGSSWLVDKTATDANGNTYYGVSTDEFVKAGEGVSFTA
ncbi:SLAP domain-containing protein [Companilactobacillus baiquanensis]|uniref:SLAP domain-containing protein n=1 Tax=Companilactobacillus baiquanensis TaxID=2486005 RepID=A0ABW1UV37_9LACO|nr:SLAP domain-containing protein [Companilactobacillus baiquanensis]